MNVLTSVIQKNLNGGCHKWVEWAESTNNGKKQRWTKNSKNHIQPWRNRS